MWHVQVLGLEFANQHVGALDQRRHLVQQGIVVDGLAAATDLGCRGGELAGNLGLALGKRSDHRAVLGQRGTVAVGIRQNHGIDRCFKAVAVGAVARSETEHLDRHHGAAVQGDQAMRRTHKMHAAPAGQFAVGFQLVAHDFGDRQLGNGFFKCLLQPGVQRRTGDEAVVKQRFGLAVGGAFEPGDSGDGIGHIAAECLQFLQQGGRGVACRVQTDRDRHQLLLHRLVSGFEPDVADMGRQSAWRSIGRDHRVGTRQAQGFELICQHGGKRLTEFLECLGRQLFDEQFDQKVFRCHVQAPFFVILFICSTHWRGAIGKPRRSRLSR